MSWENDPDDARIVKRLDSIEEVLQEILKVLKEISCDTESIRYQ